MVVIKDCLDTKIIPHTQTYLIEEIFVLRLEDELDGNNRLCTYSHYALGYSVISIGPAGHDFLDSEKAAVVLRALFGFDRPMKELSLTFRGLFWQKIDLNWSRCR